MDLLFAAEVETNAHVLGAKLEAESARSQFWRWQDEASNPPNLILSINCFLTNHALERKEDE